MPPPSPVPRFLTGAKPTPRAKLCGATPHQIRGTTPPQFAVIPKQLSFWGNNVDGCCVTTEEAFAKACYSPEIFISDNVVHNWAASHGVLNGAYLLEVLQWMQQAGFSQSGTTYNDGTPAAVDYSNAAVLTNAISQGPVKIGVAASQLMNVVGSINGWFGTRFSSDQNLDHCVSLCGYGTMAWLAQQLGVSLPSGVDGTQPGYLLFTWNTIGIIDVPSMIAITGEAWLRTPTTIVVGPTPPVPPTPPIPPTPSGGFDLTMRRHVPKGNPVVFLAPTDMPIGSRWHFNQTSAGVFPNAQEVECL